jgi:hypothetical protein
MRKAMTIAAMCIGLVAAGAHGQARAADPNVGLYAPIRQFIGALNAADAKMAVGAFVASPSLTDDIPKHFWGGPTAVADWFSDAHLTPGVVKVYLAEPVFTDVTDDRGYASFPANYTVLDKGRTLPASGMFVFALERRAGAWKILSFTWTHTPASTNAPAGVAVDPTLWRQD